MTKEDRQRILLGMKTTEEGRAVKDFLDEKIKEIGDIEGINGEVQLEARKEAKKILKKLFSFFYEGDEKPKTINPYI